METRWEIFNALELGESEITSLYRDLKAKAVHEEQAVLESAQKAHMGGTDDAHGQTFVSENSWRILQIALEESVKQSNSHVFDLFSDGTIGLIYFVMNLKSYTEYSQLEHDMEKAIRYEMTHHVMRDIDTNEVVHDCMKDCEMFTQ